VAEPCIQKSVGYFCIFKGIFELFKGNESRGDFVFFGIFVFRGDFGFRVLVPVLNRKPGKYIILTLFSTGTKYEILENRIRSNLFAQIILKTNELMKKKILISLNIRF
jgi:hypothetical protein